MQNKSSSLTKILIISTGMLLIANYAFSAVPNKRGNNAVSNIAPFNGDADRDRFVATKYGGTDCNDLNSAIHPKAVEICGNNIDEDCSGADLACDYDADNDGYDAIPYGEDCNDNNANIHPNAIDICSNNIDEDCSGEDLICLACPDGEIEERCLCGGNLYDDGYCCNNVYQPEACLEFDPLITLQPYQGNVNIARIDSQVSSYQWYVDNELIENTTPENVFLAHYNNSLESVDGEIPLSNTSISYEPSFFEQGFIGKAQYSAPDNISVDEGTIELWVKLNMPLSDPAFASEPYLFKHYGSSGDFLGLNVKPEYSAILLTAFDGNQAHWGTAVQMGTFKNDIPTGEYVYMAVTYSRSTNVASFYINGFKAARSRFDVPLSAGSIFEIGNSHVTVDELRISDRAMTATEIKENYLRGLPFARNEAILPMSVNAGQVVRIVAQTVAGELESAAIVKEPKISLVAPEGYVLANTASIPVTFTTSTPAQCKYSDKPSSFANMNNVAAGTETTHSYVIPVVETVDSKNIYIKCQNEQGEDDYYFYRRLRVLPPINNRYPKLATEYSSLHLDPANAVQMELASRYDYIGLAKEVLQYPLIPKILRERNPNILVGLYTTSYGNSHWTGGFETSFAHTDFDERLSDDWRLKNSAGEYIYDLYFDCDVMYNINPDLPFAETLADHLEWDVFARGDWDTLFLDNEETTFWWMYDYAQGMFTQYPDFNLDGIDEDLNDPETLEWVKDLWLDGLVEELTLIRPRVGRDMLIMGNNASQYPELYNGKNWEKIFSVTTGNNFTTLYDPQNTNGLAYWRINAKSPKLNRFQHASTENNYRSMRYGFAGTVIQEAYFASVANTGVYAVLRWYDEYWVDIATGTPTLDQNIGRGYLGEPVGEPVLVSAGVWKREFQNGIVVLNDNVASQTVALGAYYRHINGVQDHAANPGTLVNTVVLQGRDGRVFLRALCSNNPSGDPLCINR